MKTNLFKNFILYYSDEFYQLTTNGFLDCSDVKSPRVLVLARHHYIEKVQKFPITQKKDLKAAIAFETADLLEEFFVFHKVLKVDDGHSQVMIWQVPKTIIPESVLVILPETLLLEPYLAKGEIWSFNTLSGLKTTQIIKGSELCYSTTTSDNNSKIFAMSVGVQVNDSNELSSEQLAEKLIVSLKQHAFKLIVNFWLVRTKDITEYKTVAKQFALPLLTCLAVYLAGSSLYVYLRYDRVSNEVKAQKSEIGSALSIQRDIVQLQDELMGFKNSSEAKQPLWNIWPVLAPLFDKGVQFSFIRFNGEFVFFKGSYQSATEVLEYLYNVPSISEAAFTTSVKKQGGKESFIIKFSLIPKEVQR